MEEWKLDILSCSCGAGFISRRGGIECVDCGREEKCINGVITLKDTPEHLHDVYEQMTELEGTRLFERSREPQATSFYETIAYNRIFEEFLGNTPRDDVVLDFGCGDGRMLDWLLKKGFKHIIATDLSIHGILRYKRGMSKQAKSRVLFMQTSGWLLPLRKNSINTIISIEVVCYSKDSYKEDIRRLNDLLVDDGSLVLSEATREGAMLFFLVNHDLENFSGVLFSDIKREFTESGSLKSRVFRRGALKSLLVSEGFMIEDELGVSCFPNLVVAAFRNAGRRIPKDIQAELEHMKQEKPYRCLVLKARKKIDSTKGI